MSPHAPAVRVDPGTAKYARELTSRIQKAADGLHEMLLEAFESECWRHLSYKSWTAYIDGEFDFTRNYSYRLVKQARAERDLRKVLPAGNTSEAVHISGREARDLEPVMGEVIERVQSGTPIHEAVREVRQEITRVGRERAVFADEDYAEADHEHICRICGATL